MTTSELPVLVVRPGVAGTKALDVNTLPESAWRYILGRGLDDGEGLESLYNAVPWLYRGVQMRAEALADLPWALSKGSEEVLSSDDWKPIKGLEWTRKLGSLLYRTEQARCLFGAAYWLAERNRVRILGYRWLYPPSVRPVYDTERGLTGWQRAVGGQAMDLGAQELVYFWLPSATAELGPGPAPAGVALEAARLVRNVDRFACGFFARGAVNMTILSVEGNPAQPELERLERWWKRLLGGVKKAWETVAVRASVKPVVLSSPPKDLAMTDLSEAKQKDIAVALGVPFTLLFSEASNRATAEQDDLNFYTKCVLPEAELLTEDLNEQVFNPIGYEFAFQPSRLELFQQLEAKKAESLLKAVESGTMTPNEWRDQMDMEPHPDGDRLQRRRAAGTAGRQSGNGEQETAEDAVGDMGEPPADDRGSPVAQDRKAVELRQWERKALRALKTGRALPTTFVANHIPPLEHMFIMDALAQATTVEEVRAAFAAPFRGWEGYP